MTYENYTSKFTYYDANKTVFNELKYTNSYDPDGNLLTMQRYGSNNNLVDNFSYSYYTGTNKLKKVSGSTDQYTYDYNGNQINDYLNNNTSIKYDHRNLITEFTRQDLNQEPPITDVTRYKYDEAGNRVRKTTYRSNSSNPDPLPEEEEDIPPGWDIFRDEYYSRDVSGKEIAIYSSYTIQYWNVWSGNEITGRINFTENEARFYYLKDHLGSIRVVLDNNKSVVSANDFDLWGYYLENRTYSTTNTKNKFTGKERDTESNWDYFGARYYDARVGRWGQMEPLLEKYYSFSPYVYGILNSLSLVDTDGNILILGGDKSQALNDIKSMFNEDVANLITVNEDNIVSFDISSIQNIDDAAVELLNNLILSENTFLYEVADVTEGITREQTDINNIGAVVPLELNKLSGISNLSITERNIDKGTGPKDLKPIKSFAGQITLGTGKWTFPGTTNQYLPRSDIVFHELAENYFRTESKEPYKRVNGTGAHQSAINYASRYKKQVGARPGEVGRYEYAK